MSRTGYISKPPSRLRKSFPIPQRMSLDTATSNNFDGGWNSVDNELSIDSRFARILTNMWRSTDGSIAVRHGTRLFADLSVVGMLNLVNIEYFYTYICAVDQSGKVALIDGTGTVYVVWSPEIAIARGTVPWSNDVRFVSFAQLRNQLIICNGVDKPLSVQPNRTCNYLVDLGTLKNTNVPICKYVFAHQRYLIMAGDPNFPDRLYIGSRDTVGTFFGDPPPNDGVNIDLSTRVSGDSTITGLTAFREFLVIGFPNSTLIAKLGTYSGSAHEPQIDDPIQEIGVVSHRASVFLGDDLFFLDTSGVQSLKRAFVTGKLEPQSISDRIQNELSKAIDPLPLFSDNETAPFAIFHHNDSQYMLFVPNSPIPSQITETVGFGLVFTPDSKVVAWNKINRWNWRGMCKSLLGEIFFCKGSEIFLLGNEGRPLYGDFVGSQETWDDGTTFEDDLGWSPVSDGESEGLPIPFVWELPWSAFKARANRKDIKYVQLDAKGTGEYRVSLFVDNIYEALDTGEDWSDGTSFDDGLGWDRLVPLLDPVVSMDFVGGDAKGFGLAPFGNSRFGGGRVASDARLYELPASGNIIKLRIEGETNKPLSFSSITIMFSRGSISRS